MSTQFTLQYERIEKLETALRNLVKHFTQDALEADDLFQEIALKLMQMHPETSDGGLMLKARWLGIDYQKRAKTYLGHCIPEHELSQDAENDADTDVWDTTADNHLPIEEQVIRNEQNAEVMRAISQLPKKHQRLIAMLAAGKRPHEIAKAEGVSESAISQRIKKISIELKLTIKY